MEWVAARVVVAGSSASLCQVVASWLSEVGGGDVLQIAADPGGDVDLMAVTADIVLVVAEDEADVQLAAALHQRRLDHRPSVSALMATPSPTLLAQLWRTGIDAVAAMPLPSRFLLDLLAMARMGSNAGSHIAVLSPEFWRQLPVSAPRLALLPPPGRSGAVGMGGMSRREQEVLRLLDQDLSNDAMAPALVISPHTVKRHLENIFRKLGVSSRHAAVRVAHREGLLKTRQGDHVGLASGPHPVAR